MDDLEFAGVIPQLTGASCLPSSIAPNNTRTIVPKCHTNPLGNASDKCDGSSLLVKRNDSYPSME